MSFFPIQQISFVSIEFFEEVSDQDGGRNWDGVHRENTRPDLIALLDGRSLLQHEEDGDVSDFL